MEADAAGSIAIIFEGLEEADFLFVALEGRSTAAVALSLVDVAHAMQRRSNYSGIHFLVGLICLVNSQSGGILGEGLVEIRT